MNNKGNIILIIATLLIILLGLAIVIGNKYQRSLVEKNLSFSSNAQYSNSSLTSIK